MRARIDQWHNFLFSEHRKHQFEVWSIYLAVTGFMVHLLLIFLHNTFMITQEAGKDTLFASPISALYTPFSFILIFEVYQLIYYLPNSFSNSIAKQYEIISLILIRRIFKDISKIHTDADWFTNPYNIQLALDMLTVLILFFLIFLFYYLGQRRPKISVPQNLTQFISLKKGVSVALFPILLGLAVYSLMGWMTETNSLYQGLGKSLSDINHIFYDEFFTLLILVDVFILLISLKYTQHYSRFIISTILIRQSFMSEGLLNVVIILGGVLFGVAILAISNLMAQTEGLQAKK